jgi:hypothetical protein
VHRQADLLQIVFALGPTRRLARLLNGRKEQCDQNRNDGDDDEQFDQRKTDAPSAGGALERHFQAGINEEGETSIINQ